MQLLRDFLRPPPFLLALVVAALPGMALPRGAAAQEVARFDLVLENGRLVGGQQELRAAVGRQVEMRFTSDRAATLHLHGYDKRLALTPGVPASMSFLARASGRFPVELHGEGMERTLLYLEVRPE